MRKINTVTVARIGSHRTVKFAVEELRRYLKKMDTDAIVDVRIYDAYDATLQDLLWVGLSEDFDVPMHELDDAIRIDVQNFCGIVTGANERSVLIAVYRFLREMGICWLYPGEKGEMIPQKALDSCDVRVCESPSYRNRIVCIEGAVSYEHVHNMLDWIPKLGMNGYLVQFPNPVGFLRHWYEHENNETWDGHSFTDEDGERVYGKMREDIADRSLLYHAVGHGWTCEPFGFPSGWVASDSDSIDPEKTEMLAMTNGKRQLFKGVPTNTQICLSNPKALDTVARYVADYCVSHADITHLHVWLADDRNNFCECEKCRDKRPADLYVDLLNRVDKVMTERNISTEIVCISYNDMSWAPLYNRLRNPSRFTLMFAPITRRFMESYADVDLQNLPEEPEFMLNKLEMPRTLPPLVKLMQGWNGFSVADTCLYDYHLWSTLFTCDAGQFSITKTVNRDIRALLDLRINGLISCQVQRYAFPNGMAMNMMAKTLWNRDLDYETELTAYLTDCYGSEFLLARNYLEPLSDLLAYWPRHNEADVIVDDEQRAKAEKALEHVAQYREILRNTAENGIFEYTAQKRAWELLLYHADMVELVAKAQIRKFSGQSPAERRDAVEDIAAYYKKVEPEIHDVFDVWRQLLSHWVN